MNIRPRSLPSGWYPGSGDRIEQVITDFLIDYPHDESTIASGIVPHAGWGFSGSIACRVISHIDPEVDTIVVVGGHLPPGDVLLAAPEEGYSTPLGVLDGDMELLKSLQKEIDIKEDLYSDNTVEVQLPFIKFFFPDTHVIGMRAAPSMIADELGKVIAHAGKKLGKKVTVIGSTDLTHYGRNYHFSPHGSGKQAVQWVKEVNDRRFIEACIKMDTSAAIESAGKEKSACSAGGAVCAISFAREMGIGKGNLMEYTTSYDIHPADSFVGYAGILFPDKA